MKEILKQHNITDENSRSFVKTRHPGDIAISIIIPVYNVENYIRRFLEALKKQTLENVEFIVIDDASTDGSMRIAEEYAAVDARFRLFYHEKNLGPGAARNLGIEKARGEYLSFMDPDDFADERFLELLYRRAKEKDADIVKGRTIYRRQDGTVAPRGSLNDYIREHLARMPLYLLFTYQFHTAIYRWELIQQYHIRFGTARKDQDSTFLLQATRRAASFAMEDTALYHFCERPDSTMHTIDSAMLLAQIESLQDQMRLLSGKLSDHSDALQYIAGKYNHLLAMAAYVQSRTGNGHEVDAALKKARALLFEHPIMTQAYAWFPFLHALACFGENLHVEPFSLPWEKPTAEDYLDLVSRWVDFAGRHPDMGDLYARALNKVFGRVREEIKENEKENAQLAHLYSRVPDSWKEQGGESVK